MIDPVPFYIGGGAVHSPSDARGLVYMATQGGTGVAEATHFKVSALPVPGTAVRILPGVGAAKSRYPGVFGESYEIRGRSATDLEVTATGSGGGATRYVILRVKDPQFAGEPQPVSIADGPYVFAEIVNSITGLAYPYIPLAKITQPANTATITDAMITDIRRLALPKIVTNPLSIYPTGIQTAGHAVPTASYASWPITTAQRPTLYVPEWAVKMEVVAHFSGVLFTGTSRTVAGIRSGFGAGGAENGIIMEDSPGRYHYTVVGTHDVLESQRGTDQLINLQGLRSSGTGMWYADYQTSISLEVTFKEALL